jgi:hypothetical protein
MSESEMGYWCEALELVPMQWQADFIRFIEDGEASGEFFAFLESDAECRRACEMAFRADHAILRLINAVGDPNQPDEADSRFAKKSK